MRFFRQSAWSGSCETAFRRAFIMGGAVYACAVTGQYQGHVWQRIQSFDLPFYHLPPVPTLIMPSVGSHSKHIFPSAYSPQVSPAAPLSARRRLVVDVSKGTSQRHPSAPSRADSVRTFIYIGYLPTSDPIQGFKRLLHLFDTS